MCSTRRVTGQGGCWGPAGIAVVASPPRCNDSLLPPAKQHIVELFAKQHIVEIFDEQHIVEVAEEDVAVST